MFVNMVLNHLMVRHLDSAFLSVGWAVVWRVANSSDVYLIMLEL